MCTDVPALRAFVLDKLAWCRSHLGQPDEAVRLARLGTQLLEPIEADDHSPHLPELAVLWNDLSNYLLTCHRAVESLEAASRAVAITERLTAIHHDRHVANLVTSLRQKATVLSALDRHDQAQDLLRRADAIQRSFPHQGGDQGEE
jgi:tetratricopeptide (TPR) repeat protein